MKRSDFEYTLLPEHIAQSPASPRDSSRLMVLSRKKHAVEHRRFNEIGAFLRPGDVLVLNVTRVFPARLYGRKRSGGKVELLLLRPTRGHGDTETRGIEGSASPTHRVSESEVWQALVRGASVSGVELVFPEGLTARLETRLENGEWVVIFSQAGVRDYLERYGQMPLPPYIKRSERLPQDSETYQTVFAQDEGSIAAPTAGLHFTSELLDALRAQGVIPVEITLHVGWGTFRPIHAETVEQHVMLPELYRVGASAANLLNTARRENRRIIAVGTTAVRTLESICGESGEGFRAGSGATNLFIYPGYPFKAVDALITNFHLPHSTPLLLACAFFSDRRGETDPFSLRSAYQEAIREKYRFYSYGDAMLIQ